MGFTIWLIIYTFQYIFLNTISIIYLCYMEIILIWGWDFSLTIPALHLGNLVMMTFFPGATCLGGGSNHFGFITKCTLVGCHFGFKCVGSVNFFLVLAVALFGLPFKLLSLFGSCLFPIPELLNREGGVSLIVSLGSSVLPIAFSLFLTQVLHEASPFALPPPFSLAILE